LRPQLKVAISVAKQAVLFQTEAKDNNKTPVINYEYINEYRGKMVALHVLKTLVPDQDYSTF
jgi:hypothetical protein